MAEEFRRMMQLRGVTADWAGNTEVLLAGELAVEFAAGRTRLKAGNGTDQYGALPYIGEQDEVARAAAAGHGQDIAALASRVATVETLAPRVQSAEAAISATGQALATKQDRLPAQNLQAGAFLTWTGQAWGATDVAPQDGTLIRWDGLAAKWAALPSGAPGSVLAVLPAGQVGWRPQSGVTVRNLTLGGGASVEAAFNTLRPDVNASDLITVQFGGEAFLYGGPVGLAVNTATAAHFTRIGASVPWATAGDFTTPPGGATAVALTPALLIAYLTNLELDAGEIP